MRRTATRKPVAASRIAVLAGDRGSIAALVSVVAFALLTMIGLAVDGGGRMRSVERADDIAAEAARTGGQVINLPDAVTGKRVVISPAAARTAARKYLDDAGATGTVTIAPDGRSITVTVRLKYKPVFLNMIGLGPWTETGTATAVLVAQ